MSLFKFYIVLFLFMGSLISADDSKISLQLQWKHQFQFAGFYVAKEMGFYNEVGLDVEIREYNNSINVVDEVVNGRSTYGIGRSSLLIDRSKNKPIVALDAIFQSSPFVLISTDPSIKKITDLKNKRVMITYDALESASIVGMLSSKGVFKEDIKIQKHSFDYRDLIDGKTDAMACYLSNEPLYLEKKNIKYTVFDPKEFGFEFYSDILFSSKNELNEHPQRLKEFRDATKKGWEWAFRNIVKSAKMIYEKYNTQKKSLDSLVYEGRVLKGLAFDNNVPFGYISKKNSSL